MMEDVAICANVQWWDNQDKYYGMKGVHCGLGLMLVHEIF